MERLGHVRRLANPRMLTAAGLPLPARYAHRHMDILVADVED